MTDSDLRGRIEKVYRQETGEDDPHGALAWFARRVGVHRQTVWRWVDGRRKPGGPALSMLKNLEEGPE